MYGVLIYDEQLSVDIRLTKSFTYRDKGLSSLSSKPEIDLKTKCSCVVCSGSRSVEKDLSLIHLPTGLLGLHIRHKPSH